MIGIIVCLELARLLVIAGWDLPKAINNQNRFRIRYTMGVYQVRDFKNLYYFERCE